jgi:hypothetical protein
VEKHYQLYVLDQMKGDEHLAQVDVLIPTYMNLPTTVQDRRYNATELFGSLIQEYDHASIAIEA